MVATSNNTEWYRDVPEEILETHQ